MSDKYYQINYNALWDVISCIISRSNQNDKMAIWRTCINIVSWAVETNDGEWTKSQIAGIIHLITKSIWRADVTLKDGDAICDFPDEIISHYHEGQEALISGEKFAANEVTYRLVYLFRHAKA